MGPSFKRVVQLFQKLPGVGPRQAARFVLALLNRDEQELKDMGQAIAHLKKTVRFCRECFNIADDHICAVCSDPKRDVKKILVVEKVTDLESIEKTGLYKGLYHVLGGAISPVDGVTPEHLTVDKLKTRTAKLAKEKGTIELVLATNPNAAGETTALYIREVFKRTPNVTISHLARGLATGSNLEYADEITLKNALEYRK